MKGAGNLKSRRSHPGIRIDAHIDARWNRLGCFMCKRPRALAFQGGLRGERACGAASASLSSLLRSTQKAAIRTHAALIAKPMSTVGS
jgi:hypothetical protein